jgi:ABC-type taurine transport system ATPase subunit
VSRSPSERIDRGAQAESALKLLDEAFDAVEAAYMARQREIARSEPWAAQKMSNLAVAANIAEDVRNAIRAIVKDGEVATAELVRTHKIEQMSPTQRRYADALGPST